MRRLAALIILALTIAWLGPLAVTFNRGAPDRFYHSDAQGSRLAFSNSAGVVGARERYAPFGESLLNGAGMGNFITYTGHMRDVDTGLTYMQARLYDPVIGRFLSTDPIGYQDQLNLYAYVANDPVNNIDPNGEERFGVFLDAKLFYGAGAKGRVELSIDTESKEIRLDLSAGAGVGLRAGVEAGGFVEESRTDGTSVSGKVSVEASAAAEFRPTPLGGEIGGKLNVVEGSASTTNGLQGDSFRPEGIVEGSIGPISVNDERVSASIGIDVGVSASVDASVGASLSAKPLFDMFEEER